MYIWISYIYPQLWSLSNFPRMSLAAILFFIIFSEFIMSETTPLLGNSGIHTPENASKGAGETADFSFKSIDRRKKFILISMSFVNFCATCCFSLLAPFFPLEVRKTWPCLLRNVGSYMSCQWFNISLCKTKLEMLLSEAVTKRINLCSSIRIYT